jgi:hypothetical protein
MGSVRFGAVVVVCLAPLCWFSAVPSPASAAVVINEVLYDPDGADTGLEFVEIVNCGDVVVLMSGWTLETGNGANQDDWTIEWIGGDLDHLDPGEIYLVGEADVAPTPDYVTSLDLQNGPDAVRLTDGAAVLDLVGWGEPLFPEYYEGAPAADVSSGRSLARAPDCWDHDLNAEDLAACDAPTPGVRNSLAHDLALAVRHSGRQVFEEGEPIEVECAVVNVGFVSTEGHGASIELFVNGSDDPASSALITADLSPRDSVEVALAWDAPVPGRHLAAARLAYAPDSDLENNTAGTSLAVGAPAGPLAVNEVMYSPEDDRTEWVELVNVTRDSVDVRGWALGDDVDAFAVAVPETVVLCIVPPGGYLIVAREASLLDGASSAPVVETDGWEALSSDDTVVLLDSYGTRVDRVAYARRWGGARGVSLERVRADMPPDDPNNWGSSVSQEGSTPGRANSIHLSSLPSSGTLAVAPNPLTPDGDGVGDRAVVRFELPVPRAVARLTVFDLRGRVRAVLLDQAEVAGRGELLWDGRGLDGDLLPSGLYVLSLEALSAREGVFATARAAVGIVR